ncbi:MAG: hypothetical protein ACXACA_09075 [Candidatus Ranarchaeia archaeon]
MSKTNVKISPWGVWFDLRGLMFFVIFIVLSGIMNIFAIPIGPGFLMGLGSVIYRLISVCFGPLWYTLTLFLPIVYVAIFIHGDLIGVLLAVTMGLWISLLDKYFPPLLALFPSLLTPFLSFFFNTFISGYPQNLGLQILLVTITKETITALLFTLVIAIPNIYKFLPLRYDSWVARYWILKMEQTPPNTQKQ